MRRENVKKENEERETIDFFFLTENFLKNTKNKFFFSQKTMITLFVLRK